MSSELRYGFGRNWAEYIDKAFSEKAVEDSRKHLASLLRCDNLAGKTFLDIGCGSGIHSFAALRLGAASVHSFDYDRDSVATAKKVREMCGSPDNWRIEQGSVLDEAYMWSLPQADIVYSWGVLHHTGDMWRAVQNAAIPMRRGGDFYIALYSSDNYVEPPPEYWLRVKRAYNLAGPLKKRMMEWSYAWRRQILPELKAGRNPLELIRTYGDRGMTYWTDVKDWLGGYPMEFASFLETTTFCEKTLGLQLVNVRTGEGCSEYVFARLEDSPRWRLIEDARVQEPLLLGDATFAHHGGSCYIVARPDLASFSGSNEEPLRSRLMIYEDGKPLGLGYGPVDHIVRFGGGRFRHWGEYIYLASTDGSDPRTNGRSYTFCRMY